MLFIVILDLNVCLARSPDHAAQKQLIDEDKVLPHLSTEGLHCDCCCQDMNLLAVVHSVGLVLLTSPLKMVPQLADISSKTHIILVQIYP